MEPLLLLALLAIAIGAGVIGALFGLGGGIIFIPVLTVLFDLDAQAAAAASLIGIVATSTGSASGYVKEGRSNIRLGMMMEITTSIGAIIGATIAIYIESWVMLVVFAAVMVVSGLKMALSPERRGPEPPHDMPMSFTYTDPADRKEHSYCVENSAGGMALCTVAGVVSSLAGVGGGVIKVPLMNIYMHVPIKVASATSSYMIGITAFTGAVIYLLHGAVIADVAAAVAIGAFIGALIGTRVSNKMAAASLKRYMVVVYFAMAIIVLLKAGGVL